MLKLKKLIFTISIFKFILMANYIQGNVYKQPSSQFKPKAEVATVYIEHENRLLLLHRQNNKPNGARWSVPGGKVNLGEKPLQAAIREVKEETGYDLSNQPVDYIGTFYVEQENENHFIYHMFRNKLVGDPTGVKINFQEHKGFTWVTPQEGLKLDLIQDEDVCFKFIYRL